MIRDREHRARVSFGELPALEHREHVVRQLEQANPVRDRGLRAADPLGDLAERERELVDQDGVGTCLLDRRQLLARDVLDEAEQECLAVVGVAHHRRHRLPAGLTCGAPAPLAGDDLVAADAARTHEQRLDDTLPPHRLGQPGGRLGLETAARLPRIRVDRVDGDLEQLRRDRVAAD